MTDQSGFDCEKCDCINGIRPEWKSVSIQDLDFETRYCPKQQITPLSWQLLDFHGHYKAGHLPCPGGVVDQPAYIMQAVALIDTRKQQNEREKRGKTSKG